MYSIKIILILPELLTQTKNHLLSYLSISWYNNNSYNINTKLKKRFFSYSLNL